MPRSAAGVYTLPSGNPVVTNTLITSTWANDTMPDLGSEITNSLDRSGRGGMLAPIKGVDGTVALPLFSFTNEPSSGLYRVSAGVLGVSILGVSRGTFSAAGFTGAVVGSVTGAASLNVLKAGDAMTGNLTNTQTSNAGIGYTATNSSNGVAASASLTTVNDGALNAIFGLTSSAYSSNAFIGANAGFIFSNGAGGLALDASHASGTVRFAAGGTSEQMRLDTAGRFMVNTTTVGVAANANCWMTVGGNAATAYSSVKTASATEELLLGASAALTHMGSFSNTNLEIRSNNVARLTITAAGVISDANGEIGNKGMPISATTSGTILASDRGKLIRASGGLTWATTSVTTLGDVFTIYNNTAGSITITQGASTTLDLGGTTTTGSRTLARGGIMTITYIGGAVEGVCVGAGLT